MDHDPLFRFRRWPPTCASSRSRKSSRSRTRQFRIHPFIERLIATVRREYLDHMFFWNAIDLTRKLEAFADYYNASLPPKNPTLDPPHWTLPQSGSRD